ncbi:MAG: PD40 domain-containing protein [Anaerolineales bacterium]|nr:PD40 domain-containing protein [Anaerolineales bacterium]
MKRFVFSLVIFVMLLSGCSEAQTSASVQPTLTISSPTLTLTLIQTLLETSTKTPTDTPKPTVSPTQTPRPSTTSAPIPPTVPIATLNARATIETLEDLCLEYKTDSNRAVEISPDGEWVAIGCGYDTNQVMIIENQKDLKWVLNFADFLNPDLAGISGNFSPMAWSSDGRFLYFTKYLGWDGGGNQCFSGFGVFGLFRLHLTTGTLVTLLPTDDFYDHKIRFSPTVEYYAVDLNGVRITNLETDEVTQIDVSGVMDMRWSPDGRYLAYSIASCGDEFVESSSIFVWDSVTGQTQELFASEEMRLLPSTWIDDSILRFEGEKWLENKYQYTIFEYDLTQNGMIFSGTVTPRP